MRLLIVALLALTPIGFAADSRPRPAEPEFVGPPIPTIVEIMEEAHRCRTSYIRTVRGELQKEEPNWMLAEEKSRELIHMGGMLARNKPPRGTKEAWTKITTLYVAHATLMTDAAERRNKDDASYHARKLSAMCSTCHSTHAGW